MVTAMASRAWAAVSWAHERPAFLPGSALSLWGVAAPPPG